VSTSHLQDARIFCRQACAAHIVAQERPVLAQLVLRRGPAFTAVPPSHGSGDQQRVAIVRPQRDARRGTVPFAVIQR